MNKIKLIEYGLTIKIFIKYLNLLIFIIYLRVYIIQKELSLPSSQILALFIKIIRKFSLHFRSLETAEVQKEIPNETTIIKKKVIKNNKNDDENNNIIVKNNNADDHQEEGNKDEDRQDNDSSWDPIQKTLDEDLKEAGNEVMNQMVEKQRELINSLDLSK